MRRTTSIFASGLLLCAAGLLLPGPARGVEINGGVRGETAWNSNVFGSVEDEEDDVSFRVSPWVRLQEPRGDLTWRLEYRPSYETFLDQSELDGWDHSVSGAASWRIRPDTTVSVEERFDRFISVTRFNETVIDDAGQAIIETEGRLNRFKRNLVLVDVEHLLSPTQALFANASHEIYDPSGDLTSDRENAAATAGYRQQLTERDTLGGFLSWRRQTFETLGRGGDRETDYYNASLTWVHRFDPTFVLRASAGPTYVDPRKTPTLGDVEVTVARFPGQAIPGGQAVQVFDVFTCPTLDDGTPFLGAGCELFTPPTFVVDGEQVTLPNLIDEDVDGEVNFFADLSLEKSWENWVLRVSYRRQEADASGATFSAISDIVSTGVVWTPSPRWIFTLTGAWLRQTQSSEGIAPVIALRSSTALPGVAESAALRGLEVDNEFELTQITVGFNANYRLTRRISIFGSLLYVDLERERSGVDIPGYDRFRAAVGVSYEFEPIRL